MDTFQGNGDEDDEEEDRRPTSVAMMSLATFSSRMLLPLNLRRL
jgi:hypothetical protein